MTPNKSRARELLCPENRQLGGVGRTDCSWIVPLTGQNWAALRRKFLDAVVKRECATFPRE
jgi:hypothetical protein